MRLQELLAESIMVDEYGSSHGFPGYGMGLFRRAYYQHMAQAIHDVDDTHAREFLANWMGDLFARDNPGFKKPTFLAAVEKGGYSARPTYQQRHFYYLAKHVADTPDPHIREFLTDWLAQVAGSTNPNFQRKRWEQFCDPNAER